MKMNSTAAPSSMVRGTVAKAEAPPPPAPAEALSPAERTPDWLALTTRYVNELSFGQVTLTVHQGAVIEVQKTERTRLRPSSRS
jgi:hypothetical protein